MPRLRLLEGFLLRLARAPDAEGFVLRGGMRVRQVAGARRRPVGDVDLVCRLPWEPRDLTRRLRAILADDAVRDGVRFDADGARFAPGWHPERPGLLVRAAGAAEGGEAQISVDLRFGVPLWPTPERVSLAGSRATAPLWMCRAETVIGRKLQVITQLGRGGWRAKDLWDIDQLLAGELPDRGALGTAIEAAFAGCAQSLADLREVFGHPAWWRGARSEERWRRFASRVGAPDDLGAVVASIRADLAPFAGLGR